MSIVRHNAAPGEEWRPGVATRMRVSALTGTQDICVFEQWCAPQAGAPDHSHPVEEVLTVICGGMQVWIGSLQAVLGPGDAVVIPAGTSHRFVNPGPEELHLQAILASACFIAVPAATGIAENRWAG